MYYNHVQQFSLANKFSLFYNNITLPAALERTVASERNPDDIMVPSESQSQCEGVVFL